jgi:pimeloyl-ACP methyl ester carboxylesterase
MNDERVTLEVPEGSITIVVDRTEVDEIGTVVLAPAYGLTAEDMFLPACYLARNGLRVVRFDMRNHVGESSGAMYDFRLSGACADLRAVSEWARPAGLMAVSLSGRPAMRVAADSELEWLLLVIPVVDVEYTLEAVTELPLFKGYKGSEVQSLEVLGHQVGRRFLEDCEEHEFVTTDDAVRDFERITVPSAVLYGLGDPWVRASDVAALLAARRRRRGELISEEVPTTCHQLNQNPVIAHRFMSAATRHAVALAGGDPGQVSIPTFAEVIAAHEAVLARGRGDGDMAQGDPLVGG